MKIQIASDLHLELLRQYVPDYVGLEYTNADVLVLAGDIHSATDAIARFSQWPVPVVYIAGNHEFYSARMEDTLSALRMQTQHSNILFLENDEIVIQGTRFLGCTLWTDYLLFGPALQQLVMHEAQRRLKDHHSIRMNDEQIFAPEMALAKHLESRAWLENKLSEPFNGKTVIVTHHAPHGRSCHPRYVGMHLNAAFASDLSPLLGKVPLWIHGHVHDRVDYVLSGTRVVANPRGNPRAREISESSELVFENSLFNPNLIIEI